MTAEQPPSSDERPVDGPRARHKMREEDPYPRMIIVCIAITAVLFFVVMGIILYDFVQSDTFLPGAPGEQSKTPGFPAIPAPASAPPAE